METITHSAAIAARAVGRQVVVAVEAPVVDEAALAVVRHLEPALARAGRSVRLSLSMEARLRRDRAAVAQQAAAQEAARQDEADWDHARAYVQYECQKDEVREAVQLAIDDQLPARQPSGWEAPQREPAERERRERLFDALHERVEGWNRADFVERPVGDLTVRLRRELGVDFDPHLWDNEDWAVQETDEGVPVRRFVRVAAEAAETAAQDRAPP
jgi:hypothetical protein